MSTFIIDVPMPAMGATVSELTILRIAVAPGSRVNKGQKLAELESDKSAFDFEAPADGTILEVKAAPGDVKSSGQAIFRMATGDQSLQHLAIATAKHDAEVTARIAPAEQSGRGAAASLVWTPRAIKLAQEAGLDYGKITDIEATGPGGRVSGDDVTKYQASRR
ncbi:MAG: biotin/lipoyl-containing protein [Opitutae bacterium]